MKKLLLLLGFCALLVGCGGEGVYTKARNDNPNLLPRVYRVNYDDAYVLALHAIELQKKWKINYFDKNTGMIEASTPNKDKITIRVNSLDRSTVKIFAYCDTRGASWGAEGRLQKHIERYFKKLDSHLRGFDEEDLK